jgi:F-type H+-transporting ATPase subunit b
MNITVTLIGQSLSFFLFVIFTMKYVWPPIIDALNERTKTIADGLAAAEQGKKDFAEAQEKSTVEIDKGKDKAAAIISQAQKRGDEMIEEAREAAKKEAERVKESALSEIEQEKEKARQELRNQVASLAVAGAEKILMREVDQNAHNEVLTKISQQL